MNFDMNVFCFKFWEEYKQRPLSIRACHCSDIILGGALFILLVAPLLPLYIFMTVVMSVRYEKLPRLPVHALDFILTRRMLAGRLVWVRMLRLFLFCPCFCFKVQQDV